MTCTHSPDDAVIHELASRQHGVVTRSALLRGGVSRHTVEHRVLNGRLRRLHRDVYAVGPIAARYQREVAAALACGPDAVVSHRSAAAIWGLLPEPPLAAPVDVTSPRSGGQSRGGIRLHRSRRLTPPHVGSRHNVPLTSPERTLLDLATGAPSTLERALAAAERADLVDPDAVLLFLDRHAQGRKCGRLRRLVQGNPEFTRSEAEARFLALLRSSAVPRPEVNHPVGPFEVDFVWPEQGLIVELDGFRYHKSRAAFESDRARDGALVARGFRVIRVTWRHLTRTPEAVLGNVTRALERP